MVDIGDLATLKRRIKRLAPISFLVGAPFSWDNGAGVPPVGGFIEIMRDRIGEDSAEDLAELDRELATTPPAEKYQRAMRYLYQSYGADVVAEIVQRAVVSARKPGSQPIRSDDASDNNPQDWAISGAQAGLAKLMKLQRDQFPGPVFTTNFDPMIGLALKDVGLVPSVSAMAMDGSINAAHALEANPVNVFHLHGYWRDSSTLHVPAQLMADRPQLQSSLQRHLDQTNLVVMAYSGWDDIFTSAIARCLSDDQFKGNVTWCFYGNSAAEVREENAALFEKFKAGIQQGRIQFFCGVDCHRFFDDYIDELGLSETTTVSRLASPLAGWDIVSKDYFGGLTELSGAEAVRYFDGANPTWRHAVSPLIPRLGIADTLQDRISTGLADPSASILQLVRAAGGEGKSTAVMQAAAQAVLSDSCVVLHRTSATADLSPEGVAALDPSKQWLIILDDADSKIESLWACAEHLHQAGKTNVMFLAATRDSDWTNVAGDQKPWSTQLVQYEDIRLGVLKLEDAEKIVDAWITQGDDGLRALAAMPSREDQIAKLVKVAGSTAARQDGGSFFGAMLDARFSPAGLLDHVTTLLNPLKDIELDGGTGSLYDALVYIANCQAVGMVGIEQRVLASVMDLPSQLVRSSIIMPLGAELGAAESRNHILTRHKRVAEAIITVAETRFGTDLGAVWAKLVKHTAELGRQVDDIGMTHTATIHAGPNLAGLLPNKIERERREDIGIAAAEAAMDAKPEWSSTIINTARAFRTARIPSEGFNLLKKRLPSLRETDDMANNIRGYFFEWATCAGNIGDYAGNINNVWLACFSLADTLPVDVTLERARISCDGLCVAFGKTITPELNGVFSKARRAAAKIGAKPQPDIDAASRFRKVHQFLDTAGTPKPEDLNEALKWLSEAAFEAHTRLQDDFLRNLQKDGILNFTNLKRLLS